MSPLMIASVLLAGGCAAVLRYGVSLVVARRHRDAPGAFPRAVLVVNAAASLLAGLVLGGAAGLAPDLQLVLLTGVAGGISTFSTFAVETIELVQSGRARTAAASVGANVIVGIALATAGYIVGGSMYTLFT